MNYDTEKIYTIDEIKSVIKFLIEDYYHDINKVILFGSYSRGEANGMSDIDLVVCDSPNFCGMKVFALRSEIMENLHKSVDIFIDGEIDTNQDIYKNIVKDRVVLYG